MWKFGLRPEQFLHKSEFLCSVCVWAYRVEEVAGYQEQVEQGLQLLARQQLYHTIEQRHSFNPFLFIKNKRLFMSSEGFFDLEKKCHDVFSQANAARPVGCDSPLQIVMAVWRTFFFNLNFLGRVWHWLLTSMAVWRAWNFKKSPRTGHYHLQRTVTTRPDY